ncbi:MULTISPECIES: aminopeptidase [Mogibacterium]|uniref:M18 family aminopeptidase n=2 Tax=Mogibacterium timidum TaxID=35519 RepID=X8IRK0_9FIRM|nr:MULTISPECIES: aminopeptidase [Mogibacterium]EUC52277.1 aminopeptidase I zinc metalloprotease [Mogibacterium timidum ATCC 33093]NWO23795.1 aminopeptidase [Mogibacterium timidum]
MKDKNAWNSYSPAELEALDKLSKGYIDFISEGKTERECTDLLVKMAEEHGYRDLNEVIRNNETLDVGSKVYAVNMHKSLVTFNIGEDIVNRGMNILGAHIDSPRIDLKQNPLYETDEFAYLDTQYYGGIKKYQWVTMPLALHGVVAKKDGTVVNVNIGEAPTDPVFFISDLLIHLAQDQMQLTGTKLIDGENMDIVFGTQPLDEDTENAVKANVLKLLKDKYDIEEDDFWSAEIEAVPSGRAREAGLDRSLILGYGHDDRSCAYTSAVALFEVDNPKTTTCGLFVDKEEIGSYGATGMQSHFFEDIVRELLDRMGIYTELNAARVLRNSRMLSSDVSATYDPMYADKFSKRNAALFGRGIVFNKYTGSRGKGGSNDANAEYLGHLRAIMHKHDVKFQSAELGKVDVGGGGTIAYILALYGMEVVDSGIAVLNMHAPYEAVSKSDVYEAYKGYKAFILEA